MQFRSLAVAAAAALALAFARAAGPSGALVYSAAGQAVHFDLSTQRSAASPLARRSTRMLGHADGVLTEVDADVSLRAGPDHYSVKLRREAGGAPEVTGELPPFEVAGGRLAGPVQPAPGGKLFALTTRLQAALGEPFVDHVSVVDAAGRVLLRVRGYRNPAWLGNDRLVVANDAGLYLLALRGSSAITRIGADGVGPKPEWPAVSPDGRSVAFAQGDSIWRIGLDGSALTRLTRPHVGQNWPAWSPDGTRILVVRSACPLVGAGMGAPELAIVSSTTPNQDVESAPKVMRDAKNALRACGPVYWTR